MQTNPIEVPALDDLHVVVVGNVFDGIDLIGPFLSFDDAEAWADQNAPHEWWVTRLTSSVRPERQV